jgi:hypothetical protein
LALLKGGANFAVEREPNLQSQADNEVIENSNSKNIEKLSKKVNKLGEELNHLKSCQGKIMSANERIENGQLQLLEKLEKLQIIK